MAITTYAELKAAITDWLDRADLSVEADTFIAFAENTFNDGFGNVLPVRSHEMTKVATIALVSGGFAIPSDYLTYRSVVATGSPLSPLRYVTPQVADNQFSGASGTASVFTIVGNQIIAYPEASEIKLTYVARIPALSDVNTSNWLLARSPALYLNAALMHAALYIKDDTDFQRRASLASGLVEALNRAHEQAEYANVTMSISGAV